MGDNMLFYIAIVAVLSNAAHVESLTLKNNILGPPLPHRPFVIAWDVASEHCEENFGVHIDLSDFDIVYNENKGWWGGSLVIFYSQLLGYHPMLDKNTKKPINGGIPQLGDLNAHLTKAEKDIVSYIPDPNFQGLAVIDWESWHPLWDRMNFGDYLIYCNMSIDKVKAEHPDWPPDKIIAQAKSEYESAAWAFLSFTLSLGKILRPKALWGYYLYPDCYNYDKQMKKTDLRCTNSTLRMNDQIQWLFDDSTGLYPSVYLGEWFKDNKTAMDYVAYRILEAIRVDENRKSTYSIPVFAYHLIAYRREIKFLDVIDLRDSIGVSSLLGASGMLIWGDHNVANTAELCKNLSDYISNTLGPYVKATSDYASQCSNDICSGNGRCVLSKYPLLEGNHGMSYLNIDDAEHIMNHFHKSAYKAYDSSLLMETFGDHYALVCQCYNGWTGQHCSVPKSY